MLDGNSTNHNPVRMDIQVKFWYFEGVPLGSIHICYKVAVYSRTSLIRTPEGQSEVSVLERCPYKRGHNDDSTFTTPLIVLSVQ